MFGTVASDRSKTSSNKMTDFSTFRLFCLSLVFYVCNANKGQGLDPINLLSSCGNDCWKDPKNTNIESINPKSESFDGAIIKCMQGCFAKKTGSQEKQDQLPPEQILKIKVASYCGYVCYNNNKASKRSLDYCYAGCLGTILQSKPVQNMQPKPAVTAHLKTSPITANVNVGPQQSPASGALPASTTSTSSGAEQSTTLKPGSTTSGHTGVNAELPKAAAGPK